MRILEYGWVCPKQVKCNHCGSILEYVPKDLKLYNAGYYLLCPVCDKRIYTDNYHNKLVKEKCEYISEE